MSLNHFAKIENDRVKNIIVIPDEEIDNGPTWIAETLGFDGLWVQIPFEPGSSKLWPEEGMLYDPEVGFHRDQPYPSWTLGPNNFWLAPYGDPQDGKFYRWSEEQHQANGQGWVEFTE